MRRIGACARWRARSNLHPRPSIAFGRRSTFSRIAPRPSSFPPTPLFVDKVRDIVGLYLAPPERALVLCVDERSQIQALDRSQPLPPMRPGQIERRTHDYTRHGTLSLFAALDVATGKVVGRCYPRHRGREFLALPARDRTQRPTRSRRSPDHGQLRHSQDRADPKMARCPDPMACSLHAHRQFMGQSGRALLRQPHRKANPPRRPPLHRRTGNRDPSLSRRGQRRPKAFRMDQIRRRHSRPHQALLPQNPGNRRSPSRNRTKLRIRIIVYPETICSPGQLPSTAPAFLIL
jgi:hypothetical protein